MGRLFTENDAFVYEEGKTKHVLLDCHDSLSNKSRIPMRASNENPETISSFLVSLFRQYPSVSAGTDEIEYEAESLIMNVLLTSGLIKSSAPVKAVEFGCGSGVLNYYLASVLGKFNRRSSLCCVCDVIGDNSSRQWLDRISEVSVKPELSMMVSDYGRTDLAPDYFDIAVINGTADFQEPYEAVREAKRLVKNGGKVFCYCPEMPLLESSFWMEFPESRRYSRVMVSLCKKEKQTDEKGTWYKEAEICLECAKERWDQNLQLEEVRALVQRLEMYTDIAMSKEDFDMKVRLIEAKGRLLEKYFVSVL